MDKLGKMSEKEFNFVLQNKLSKITQVLPKEDVQYEEENEDDITDTVKPFYGFLQIIGLQQFTFNGREMFQTGVMSKLYSFILALAIICAEIYYIYIALSMDATQTPSQIITLLLKLIPPTISAVFSLILSATCYQKLIVRVLNNISIIDNQLNVQNKNIYIPARNKMMFMFLVIFFLTILMYVFLFYVSEEGEYPKMIINNIIIGTFNEFISLEICALLYIITIRMNILNTQLNATKYDTNNLFNMEVSVISKKKNELMDDITKKLGMYTGVKSNKSDKNNEKIDDITRLMRVFDRLADNANIVNSCFGIPLLCSAISAFMNILSTVNELINVNKRPDSGDEFRNISIVTFCMRGILFVLTITIIIEKLQARVNKTSNIINKLSIVTDVDPEREELLDRFSQLMSCRKFTITACNFFPFDFTFIYSLVGAVATYTVILLQVNPPGSSKNSTQVNETLTNYSITANPTIIGTELRNATSVQ